MQGCKCFFIVARSVSVILYSLILVWQQCNMERRENSLTWILSKDYPNKLLPCLACYTVFSLPWHVIHNKPKHLLQGTSKNVSLFLPCEASALDEHKIRARRIAPPFSRACASVKLVSFTRQVGRVLSSPWREELGNEVVTRVQSSACYVVKLFLH